jgi:uncharacterized membrane protein
MGFIRFVNFLAGLRNQMWLIPAVMAFAAAALLYFVLSYNLELPDAGKGEFFWLFGGDAERARGLLATLLGGLITMTALVVSVTFVTLSLAANQLGPRLIWNFIGDRQIQTVIGLFLATIIYLLLLLRSLDGTDVPALAVSLANALTICCLFALLFYVHKIAHSIVADTVVERVFCELKRAIASLPEAGKDPLHETMPGTEKSSPSIFSLGRQGYIQTVDYDALAKLAAKVGGMLRLHVRPGDFILASGDHAEYCGAGPPGGDFETAFRAAFQVGAQRSPAQDIAFTINQLTEIAVRALSPGLNDLFTAIAVIDRLTVALEDILNRDLSPMMLCDEEGCLRLAAPRSDFDGFVKLAFDDIRRNGRTQAAILIRLADSMGKLVFPLIASKNIGFVPGLIAFLDRLEQTAEAGLEIETDLAEVREHIAAARRSLLVPEESVGDPLVKRSFG